MERVKAITEEILRLELRNSQPDTYYIPVGKILTPAAREYLQQRKIRIAQEGAQPRAGGPRVVATEVPPMPQIVMSAPEPPKPRFVDYETGAYYMEKPEHMTHLYGNVLVVKNHPRILFRGRLDSLQAMIVLAQVQIAEGGKQKLVDDLGGILAILREMMRCDVLDEAFSGGTILGLTHAELRERSHDPKKFFGIQQMVRPDCTMGRDYALLNQIRTAVRETEVAAAEAFRVGARYTRGDIIEELNRLSSAIHIMMCMYLAGQYR